MKTKQKTKQKKRETRIEAEINEGLEMAQWLRVLVTLAEDLGSISSSHRVAHTIH